MWVKEKYKCCKCNYQWEYMRDARSYILGFEKPPIGHPDNCFKCGSLYIKWISYEKWLKK